MLNDLQPYPIKKGEIYKYIRLNPFKKDREEELREFLGDKLVEKKGNTFIARDRNLNFGKFKYLDSINIQDYASMHAVENLSLGKKHLDCCAAPGNKTIYTAQLMENKGTILALDKNIERLKNMQSLLRTHLITNTVVVREDLLNSHLPKFPSILLDAPCTGEGTMVNQGFETNLKEIHETAELQKKLITKAYKILETGGTLIYSTCTLNHLENEAVVQHLLETTDAELKKVKTKVEVEKGYSKPYSKEMEKTVRFYPHLSHTIGFFIAKVVK